MPSLFISRGGDDLSSYIKDIAGIGEGVCKDAGFGRSGGVGSLLRCGRYAAPARFPSRKAGSNGGTWSAQPWSAGTRKKDRVMD